MRQRIENRPTTTGGKNVEVLVQCLVACSTGPHPFDRYTRAEHAGALARLNADLAAARSCVVVRPHTGVLGARGPRGPRGSRAA